MYPRDMTQLATVVTVMIASPADVPEGREAVYRALHRWNESNTANRNVVLLPLRWETSTTPVLGSGPQQLINTQLLGKADILIALFGSRLGTATHDSVSGTVEEINKAQDAGKPVHLYFSDAPHANDVDVEQLTSLREFKAAITDAGLYGSFTSPEELTAHVWQAIEHDLSSLTPVPRDEDEAGTLVLQPGYEQIPKTDSRGRLTTETKRWIEVINNGKFDAENLTLEPTSDGLFVHSDAPTTVHASQSRRFPLMLTWGAVGDPTVKAVWTMQGRRHEKVFYVG